MRVPEEEEEEEEPWAFHPIGRRAQIQDLIPRHASRLSVPTSYESVRRLGTPDATMGHSTWVPLSRSSVPRRAPNARCRKNICCSLPQYRTGWYLSISE